MMIHTRRATHASVLGASMLAAVAALAMVGPASAQSDDADGPLSVTVRYRDLNLASEAGAKAMFARIESAARRVCGEAPDLRDLGRVAVYDHCRSDTVARTVRTLGEPLVAAVAGMPSGAVALNSK